MGTRKIDIKMGPNGPEVDHLTGPEAKACLRQFIVELQNTEAQRAAEQKAKNDLVTVIAALVHREAIRGIVGIDGNPALPMKIVIPAVSIEAGGTPWSLEFGPVMDQVGAIELVVRRPNPPATPTEPAPPKLIL